MEDSVVYKWVVEYVGSGDFKGGVFTDTRLASEFAGTSESTFKRRAKGKNYFYFKDYKIMRLPYYKSKRGRIDNE